MAVLITGSKFNDGNFLPKSINGVYADEQGNVQVEAGKIDAILVNGIEIPIVEKKVDLQMSSAVIKTWEADD